MRVRLRAYLLLGSVVPLMVLCGCGGDSTPVASTPAPAAAPAPAPVAPPPPATHYDTAEYQRSNAAVQAGALAAYQAGATGAGVTVAVIDSGVDPTSPEFSAAGKISPFSADVAGSRGIQDDGGHGTAVSDVLLGAKNDSGIHGVALGATLLVARTDTPGSCFDTTSSDPGCKHDDNAIARGVDLAIMARARVINISLGGSSANSNLRDAIGRATAAGIIIVIAGGNNGVKNPAAAVNPDPLAQIALDPVALGLVLIAGATDSNKMLADFSNKAGNGAAFYLTALGVRVRSIDPTLVYSGTSFSTPVVSAAAALLAQAYPNWTATQIVRRLLVTATDLGATGIDSTYGNGELDLARAFAPQGQTSLGTSGAAISLSDNGSLSAPMGDAGAHGLSATIRDTYGDDFPVNLAPTLARAPLAPSLVPALTDGARQLSARGPGISIALSVADRTPEPLLLSHDQAAMTRALAGSVTQRIGRDTVVALGFARGSDALDRAVDARSTPAFLVADADRGMDKAPTGAFAMRQRVGRMGVILAAETGDVRLWQRGHFGPRGDGYRGYGYGTVTIGMDGTTGPLAFGGRLMRMSERETVLGSRFANALAGGGATSWFADARATLVPADHWRIGGALRRGWTLIPASVARGSSTVTTQAFTLDVARTALLTPGDSLALRWTEPLRVTDGGLNIVGGPVLSLAPAGHERDLEGVYARDVGPGSLTLNGYWRQQAGNYAHAPDDLGAALRYSIGF